MRTSIKLWTSTLVTLMIAQPIDALPVNFVQQANLVLSLSGEGGEGGEAGTQPSSYKLLLSPEASLSYSAKAVQARYVALAYENYQHAQKAAAALDLAIIRLTSKPSKPHLNEARIAWRQARSAYLPTEVYRYFDSPIDDSDGPEPRINAWPLNEAVIEALHQRTGARTDLIGASNQPMTAEIILARDQIADEADVTTGFHAIEFLLWGEDTRADGPGNRSSAAFLAVDAKTGNAIKIRRSQYLRVLSKLLLADLTALTQAWDAEVAASYAQKFTSYDQFEALGRMLRGLASLSVEELASERLTVALDSGAQEDETSCFSDQTHLEFADGVRGIQAVWLGQSAAGLLANPGLGPHPDSLAMLIRGLDVGAANNVSAALLNAQNAAAAIDAPFDQTLLTAANAPERARAEALAAALNKVGQALQKAGRAAGVLVSVPGV